MTPRQLRYFIEIARRGSITTAASTLHIAQPALSHHIAAMEDELGVALLRRHARGVRLTLEGQRFFDRATSILRQMERLKEDVRGTATQPRGVVRACVVGSVAFNLAVPLFRLLKSRLPEVDLQLTTAMSREAQSLVETKRVDLALMPTAFEVSRLESVPVFEEEFWIFGTAELMGDESGPLPIHQVGKFPLVEPDRENDLRKIIERAAASKGSVLNVQYEMNNSELLRSMVYEGLACSIMPRNAFSMGAARNIAARPISDPALTRTQCVVWSTEQPLTPAGVATRDLLLELIASMLEDGRLHGRSVA